MTDVAGLFLILTVIYVSDCIVWVRADDWLFWGLLKGRWKVHHGPQILIGDRGGLAIVGILPPFPTYIRLPDSRDVLSDTGKFIPKVEKELSFDNDALRQRIKLFLRESLILQITGNLMFLLIFLLLPIAIWTGTLSFYWFPLLIFFLFLWVLGVTSFYISHKHLFKTDWKNRIRKTLLIGISPISIIRASNQLSKYLFEQFHPVPVCYHFCSRSEFKRIARILHYDEANIVFTNITNNSASINALLTPNPKSSIAKYLNSINYLEQIHQPPVREDSSSMRFCPRCHCQYRKGFDTCADCNGVELIPFK